MERRVRNLICLEAGRFSISKSFLLIFFQNLLKALILSSGLGVEVGKTQTPRHGVGEEMHGINVEGETRVKGEMSLHLLTFKKRPACAQNAVKRAKFSGLEK
jgi:hypothetical protein